MGNEEYYRTGIDAGFRDDRNLEAMERVMAGEMNITREPDVIYDPIGDENRRLKRNARQLEKKLADRSEHIKIEALRAAAVVMAPVNAVFQKAAIEQGEGVEVAAQLDKAVLRMAEQFRAWLSES